MNDEMDRIFELCDLVPAIVQDDGSGEVIMLAYMNRESFRKSFETGEFWHFDRARGKLSNLAPSGAAQRLASVRMSGEADALLVRVTPTDRNCANVSAFDMEITGI